MEHETRPSRNLAIRINTPGERIWLIQVRLNLIYIGLLQ
jgi:hypothetical protein